jgi:hypothetical protein
MCDDFRCASKQLTHCKDLSRIIDMMCQVGFCDEFIFQILCQLIFFRPGFVFDLVRDAELGLFKNLDLSIILGHYRAL